MGDETRYEYKEGQEAFEDGKSQKDNPYTVLDERFKLWLKGFRYARDNHSDGD